MLHRDIYMERKFSMDKYHLQMQKINQNQKSTMLLNYQLFINLHGSQRSRHLYLQHLKLKSVKVKACS